jgi:hypothetical protein
VLVSYIYNDVEGDQGEHGDLFHANDTYAVVVDVGDAATEKLTANLPSSRRPLTNRNS